MLDNTFGLLAFSYAVIGRRSNLMLVEVISENMRVFVII